jgi:hypothetical protein
MTTLPRRSVAARETLVLMVDSGWDKGARGLAAAGAAVALAGSAPAAAFAPTPSRIGQAIRTSPGIDSIQTMTSATREPGGMPSGVGSGPVWRSTAVANRPGAITCTRTPAAATSSASDSLKPMTPNFDAQ